MQTDKARLVREKDHFDRLARKSGQVWWGKSTPAGMRRLKRRARLTLNAISGIDNPSVLELGSGTGGFSGPMLEERPSLNFTGCDISPECVQLASERYKRYPNAHFDVCSITSLFYGKDHFDAVIGNSILHHLPLSESLSECLRVLKPGGNILFFEPNMMNPQVAVERNMRFIGRLLQNSEDETAFFRRRLTKALVKAGFCDVLVEPFDFLHPLVPQFLIDPVEKIGELLERAPILKEISGSLFIRGHKECCTQ